MLNLLAGKAINRFLAGVKNAPAAGALVGAEFEEVENCEDGGTLTYRYDVDNMESDPKAGDSFSVTANNCKYGNVTDSGRLSFVVNNYTGSWQGNYDETFVGQIDISVDADHLRSATANTSVDMDGDMRLTADTRASNYWYYTMKSNSLTYTSQVGSFSQTVTVSNVDSAVRDNFAISASETTKMTYNFAVASSALNGSGSVALLETIVGYWDATAPSAGKVRVTGSNGTLVMTYLPGGNVALQLQRDGAADVTRTVSRSDLDDLFELDTN